MPTPLVSICIPTFNGEEFLAEAMDSAICQTYSNLEIVVSDDASKDNTLKIVEAYQQKTHIPIRVFHHTPSGIGANWNFCMRQARGEYIKFLFQDDLLAPDCIEKMISVFAVYPDLGLVASKRTIIMSKKEKDRSTQIWLKYCENLQLNFENNRDEFTFLDASFFGTKHFLAKTTNVIGEPTAVMFKSDIVSEIGYFDESFVQILDYEYWFRILRKHPIAIINEPLVSFRLHDKQATAINQNRKISDYEVYEQILYKDYFGLLHRNLKIKLLEKFHPFLKYIIPVLKKIRRLFKKLF